MKKRWLLLETLIGQDPSFCPLTTMGSENYLESDSLDLRIKYFHPRRSFRVKSKLEMTVKERNGKSCLHHERPHMDKMDKFQVLGFQLFQDMIHDTILLL